MHLRVTIKAEFMKVVWDSVITSFFFVLTDRQVLLRPQSSNGRLIAHLLGIISVSEQLCQNNDPRSPMLQQRGWETQMLRWKLNVPWHFFFLFTFKIRWTLELFKLNINFLAESSCFNECCIEHIGLTLRRGSGFKASWHVWQVYNASSQCRYTTNEGNLCHLPH